MATQNGIDRTLALLTRTPNPSSNDVLRTAMRSESASVRVGSAQALAKRRGLAARHALLADYPTATSDVSRGLRSPEIVRRMRQAVVAALKGDDLSLAHAAACYASDVVDYPSIPPLVDAASRPGNPAAARLATVALALCKGLAERIHSARAPEGQQDPAFARRASVNALVRAIDAYREHGRSELVEAFLSLAPLEDLSLQRILQDQTHPANALVLETLTHSPAIGVMHVLGGVLLKESPPRKLVEVLRSRCDKTFVAFLLDQYTEGIPLRVREFARSMDGFAWAEEACEPMLLELVGEHQAAALRLAAETRINRRRLSNLVERVLSDGKPAAKVAACEVAGGLQSKVVKSLLKHALMDDHPDVVAAAAAQLRVRGVEGSIPTLIALLDHDSSQVKSTAQRELKELSLSSYLDHFEALDEPGRRSAGLLIGKADPEAFDFVREELKAAGLKRRLRALELADYMGLGDVLCDELITLLKDNDAGVRGGAARALASVKSDDAISALTAILEDVNATVREIAEEGLRDRSVEGQPSSISDTAQEDYEL